MTKKYNDLYKVCEILDSNIDLEDKVRSVFKVFKNAYEFKRLYIEKNNLQSRFETYFGLELRFAEIENFLEKHYEKVHLGYVEDYFKSKKGTVEYACELIETFISDESIYDPRYFIEIYNISARKFPESIKIVEKENPSLHERLLDKQEKCEKAKIDTIKNAFNNISVGLTTYGLNYDILDFYKNVPFTYINGISEDILMLKKSIKRIYNCNSFAERIINYFKSVHPETLDTMINYLMINNITAFEYISFNDMAKEEIISYTDLEEVYKFMVENNLPFLKEVYIEVYKRVIMEKIDSVRKA